MDLNEHKSLYKTFKSYIHDKNETKAREFALLLISSDYPRILKKDALKFLNENEFDSLDKDNNSNIANKNLYNFVNKLNSSKPKNFLDDNSWYPWRLYDFLNKEKKFINNQHKYSQENYINEYLNNGTNVLKVFNDIDTDLISNYIKPFFDYSFYRTYPDLREWKDNDLLTHYVIRASEEEKRSPNSLFDNQYFVNLYPWVCELKINPLFIFLIWPEQFKNFQTSILRKYQINLPGISINSKMSWACQSYHKINNPDLINFERVNYLVNTVSSIDRRINPTNKSLNLHIVIPDFSKGGGGHMTIFRMIKHLEDFGHKFHIWIKDYNKQNHKFGPQKTIRNHFQDIKAQVSELNTHFAYAHGDGLIATSWDTVEIVLNHKSFLEKFYLVQDYEPFFFAKGSEFIKAEETYKKNIKTICASKWLDRLMRENFQKDSCFFNLSFNKEIYFPKNIKKEKRSLTNKTVVRIAVYSRIFTSRRAVELAIEGLQELSKENYSICIDLFGIAKGLVKLPINMEGIDHGILSPEELSDLYSKCDLGLTFSCTNYALVPQEMMACKLPVIEIDIESNREIYPSGVVKLAYPTPKGICKAITEMIDNNAEREQIINNALDWVNSSSWENSFNIVNKFISENIYKASNKINLPKNMSERYLKNEFKIIREPKENNYLATIVIPTFNGGDLLINCISKLIRQKTDFNFEILIIDSCSFDESIEKIPQDERISIYEIPQKEFQHGRTRNLAISLAKGEFISFLTQDAIPINNYWLKNIIAPFINDKNICAVFGKHTSHSNHPEYIKEEIESHFNQFNIKNNYKKEDNLRKYYLNDVSYRQNLHYYSDNNSCLRKSEWLNFPYHDVDYGEDQLYADWIIQINKTKSYASNALVSHSHDYSVEDEYYRSETEAYFFFKYFGYDLSQNRLDTEKTIENFAREFLNSDKKYYDTFDIEKKLKKIRAKLEGYISGVEKFKNELIGNRFI